MPRDKKDKRIRVVEEQRRRERQRLLKIKKHLEPINKMLEQVKKVGDYKD